jgi:hypothetical protein
MRLPCLPPAVVLALAVAGGCGSGSSKTSDAAKNDPTDVANKTTPELPALGEAMPVALDEGRLKASPPEGWTTPSRSKKYVVHFQISKLAYPRIGIMAEDYEDIENVTGDNVEEFAKQISAAIKKAGSKLSHPVRPFSFGGWVGVTHERQAKDGKFLLERRLLETVVGNRKYTFELLAQDGTVEKYWPHLLAVAAGVEYVKAGGEASKTSAAKTAEKPPAEPEKNPDEAAEKTPEAKTPEVKTPAKKRPTFDEDI